MARQATRPTRAKGMTPGVADLAPAQWLHRRAHSGPQVVAILQISIQDRVEVVGPPWFG